MADPNHEERERILVVDDDQPLLRVYQRALQAFGYEAVCTSRGEEALQKLKGQSFGAIISDISMPGLDGLGFLRAVRATDLDIPVILITGNPTVATAAEAVAEGAFRYLFKPTDLKELEKVLGRAVRLHQATRLQRQALVELGLSDKQLGDRAGLAAGFGRALGSLWLAFQPIVSARDGALFGYEALLRSQEPTLPHPGAFLDAAERLGRLNDLGRAVRRTAAEQVGPAPLTGALFLNLHPADLGDDQLLDADSPLARLAGRVILEITERSMLGSVAGLAERVTALRKLGYRLAVDDLGAGYAGLSSVAQLEPEVVKLDMSLIRGIAHSPVKQRLVRSVVALCRELGSQTVAEGIETPEELATVVGLGCDLLQGYLLGRPGRPFPSVALDPAGRPWLPQTG